MPAEPVTTPTDASSTGAWAYVTEGGAHPHRERSSSKWAGTFDARHSPHRDTVLAGDPVPDPVPSQFPLVSRSNETPWSWRRDELGTHGHAARPKAEFTPRIRLRSLRASAAEQSMADGRPEDRARTVVGRVAKAWAVARLLVLGVPFVAVSWWLLSPFFIDDVVNEDFTTSIADGHAGARVRW